jgi:AcrR family transcriptional regulator
LRGSVWKIAGERPQSRDRRRASVPKKKGRRPGESGARAQIAAAARRQFGERGYARTTIRSIAAEASVDPALVIHYFGTKQRLFGEVVDLCFEPEALVASVADGPAEERGARLARFVVDLLSNPRYGAAFTALLHAATSEPEAASLWRERIRHSVFLPLVGKLELDDAELRAALAATQTFGLVVTYHVLKMDALLALSDEELVQLVAPALNRYLAQPL